MTAGNFSQAPFDVLAKALSKGYVSVHVEQGVPVLDRDLNLLGDLISATLQQIVHRHIGDGIAGTADFAITSNPNPLDFVIAAGTYLAGGLPITLGANSTYLTQSVPPTAVPPPPLPALTAPSAGQPNPRIDTVYLDVWSDEIDDTGDRDLGNGGDLGLRTSTRTKAQFVVRVAENASTPPVTVPAQHVFIPIAQLSRPAGGGAVTIKDQRQTHLSIVLIARRLTAIEAVLSPVIDGVAPNLVLPGQANPMVVTGRNLNLGGATVMLGSVPAPIDPASTSTSLVVPVPSASVPGQNALTVQTLIGTTRAPMPVTVETPPPPPVFIPSGGATGQIVPSHAPTGSQITLNGSQFTGVNRVTFNVMPPVYAVPGGDLISVADTAIKVNVPATLSVAVGSAMTITVSVDGVPAMTATSDTLFTVDPQPIQAPAFGPTGSQITTTPSTSPVTQSHGGQVTLHGSNFGTSAATTSVSFIGTNTIPALPTDFVSITPTAITVKVPAALTVAAAPNNRCFIAVTVQSLSVRSQDTLLVT
jgi:hypothetical protein